MTLPESTPSLPEYTPIFNNYMRPSQNLPLRPRIICDPPRIDPSLSEYTPIFNTYMRPSHNLPLRSSIYPLFRALYMHKHPRRPGFAPIPFGFRATSVSNQPLEPTGVKSGNMPPLPDYTRVDCGRPRIYPGVDPGLYPRVDYGGSKSLPVPPRIHPFLL